MHKQFPAQQQGTFTNAKVPIFSALPNSLLVLLGTVMANVCSQRRRAQPAYICTIL